uniref:Bombyx mori nuclear polyhedrosis virus chitinase n=1 Tax=Bombyx mori nuclear polyhedrosis virus TaxID=271108 RepID=Q90160_NPVBM|nr:orf2 [Bombyx mori nucleopolyhedrovirus]
MQQAAVTAGVDKITIDHLLLRQINQFVMFDCKLTFQTAQSGKRPAGATHSLIFYASDFVETTPVKFKGPFTRRLV